jgi:hypothetical protein
VKGRQDRFRQACDRDLGTAKGGLKVHVSHADNTTGNCADEWIAKQVKCLRNRGEGGIRFTPFLASHGDTYTYA